MPRPGGEADKFGNRYESLWVVDAVLDVIEGEYVTLVAEAIGDEDAGVEFYRTNSLNVREYHSIKRQHSRGNWTVSRLTQGDPSSGRSILGDLLQKARQGCNCVFSSGTSATELEELIENAVASDSFEILEERLRRSGSLSGAFKDRIVPICDNDTEMAYTLLRRLVVRTKNESELKKDVERRIRSMCRMGSGGPVDPTAIRLLMSDFVADKLGTALNANSFLSYLSEHDVKPSLLLGDVAIGQRMRILNKSYLREIDALLINRTEIDREESAVALAALLSFNKSVMLEGEAGGGKSCALAQTLKQLEDNDVPSLVIRLDGLTENDISAQAIGTNRGLPDSPIITLGEFAGDRTSVLCIDQLDALSIISARHQSAWNAFNEMLYEAGSYPKMKILFVCRSFDLEKDRRLHELVADNNQVERIAVGELDSDTVKRTVSAAGVAASSLNDEQIRILSTPLHLYLFLEVAGSHEFNFTSKGDLFDVFWSTKASNVSARLNGRYPGWTQAISTLCEAMSLREDLIVPEYTLDECSAAIQVMASEGVVFVLDGYVRFFHETFFDYSFTRTFLRSNRDLVQWLLSDDQALFRRSQVRQVLAFLRDREPDGSIYLSTLRNLLEETGIRFHIKKLILQWLSALPNPTLEEWVIVESLEGQLDGHVWQVVGNSIPWFDVLQDMDKWSEWLCADDHKIDMTIRLLCTPDVLSARSSTVAALIGPLRDESAEWRSRMCWLVETGNAFASPEMQELVLDIIIDGTLDDAGQRIAMNSDWWTVWYSASTQKPAFTAKVLGAWFDRQVSRASDVGLVDPFGSGSEFASHSQFSGNVIVNCASAAPLEFVRELFQRISALEERPTRTLVSPSSDLGEPDDQLRNSLVSAMVSLAEINPEVLDSIVDHENPVDTKWMSSLLLRAWSANPVFYAERIVQYILHSPENRLTIGYDFSLGVGDVLVAVSRTAVAAASSLCSDESFAELEDAILRISPDWEREYRLVGRTELALLSALSEEHISETVRQRIQELRHRFPDAPERGTPTPFEQDQGSYLVRSPIPEESLPSLSDEQLLSEMARYNSDSPTLSDGQFLGGAVELSRDIRKLVVEEPERFAALVNRMDTTHSPFYFEDILGGLATDEDGTGRPGTLEQVCTVLRRVRDLHIPASGVSLSWSIGAIAKEEIPDDILGMLCLIALEDPDPEYDWETSISIQGLNSARGAATGALAKVLFANTDLWDRLKSTVEQVVEDDVLAVRHEAAAVLLAILDTHRADALALFEKLTSGADPILGTESVGRFINFAMFRDYSVVRPILLRMLGSNSSDAVRAGGRFMAAASLLIDEALGDEEVVLRMDEEVRVGAVQAYIDFLPQESVSGECEKRLVSLFQDESEAVRREASRCWLKLDADKVALKGPLISTFAQHMEVESDANIICYRLKDTRLSLPIEVCELAERAIELYGAKVTSYQFGEAGIASDLFTLMIRLHEENSDALLRTRILDIIDKMVRAGVIASDEQLRRQFDRVALLE